MVIYKGCCAGIDELRRVDFLTEESADTTRYRCELPSSRGGSTTTRSAHQLEFSLDDCLRDNYLGLLLPDVSYVSV